MTSENKRGEFSQRNRTHLPDLNKDHIELTQRKENTTDGKYTTRTITNKYGEGKNTTDGKYIQV
jgi:hypothetical protein